LVRFLLRRNDRQFTIVSGSTTTEVFLKEKQYFWQKLFMASALKYMVDEKGHKTSVLVPIKTWDKINEDYYKLQNKLNFILGLKEAFNEVKTAKKTGKKLQTLKDFLRESNS
jgi:hypothetical protein